MAYGAVLKFIYEGFLGLANYFLGDWRSFEGWCVAQGCNPQQESSRRMVSLMCYFVEKDLNEEGREQFRNSLEAQSKRHLRVVRSDTSEVAVTGKQRWKAPPGWTPPGWDEEKSYKMAKQFMGFNANPK